MSYGPDWLNVWENKKESRYEPPKPVIPSLKDTVLNEVSRYLAQGLARELTDKILSIITESKRNDILR